MTFLEVALKTLEIIQMPLTASEIWEKAIEFGIAKLDMTTGKTPVNTLSARIYVEIRDNDKSKIVISSKRPTKFALISWSNKEIKKEPIIKSSPEKTYCYREHDLHPILAYYAYNYLNTLTKTINDKISKGGPKGKNEWLHPDMVGLDISSIKDFKNSVISFSKQINQTPIKVYSYEIKRKLEFSNLRECYFQAVSNSRWANKGYLVCSDIDLNDNELLNEIGRLTVAYGIGIIKLDINNPDESRILFESGTNDIIEWGFVNYLFELNEDYKTFIEASNDIVKTEKLYKERYDKIFNQDEILKYVRELT